MYVNNQNSHSGRYLNLAWESKRLIQGWRLVVTLFRVSFWYILWLSISIEMAEMAEVTVQNQVFDLSI